MMKSRLELPGDAELSPEQQEIRASIERSRGNLDGPFLAWLHSPGLAGPAERLGAFCRFGTILSLKESELLILCVAAHHRCPGEQQIHEPIARKAGLGDDVIVSLRESSTPTLDDARSKVLYQLAIQLLRTNRIEQTVFQQARQALGDQGLVEAVGIIGYYAFVAMTLNAFEMEKA